MNEIKRLIAEHKESETTLGENDYNIDTAIITILGCAVHVCWDNGIENNYTIKSVEVLTLIN